MVTETINLQTDMVTAQWNPVTYCFEFYIFSKDQNPVEKGTLLARVPLQQIYSIKGLKRDFKYLEKRLDEIDARSKKIIEKIRPTSMRQMED